MALVDAGVPLLDVLDDQGPLARADVVPGQEPLVGGESALANRQDVNVPVTDPSHLKEKERKIH